MTDYKILNDVKRLTKDDFYSPLNRFTTVGISKQPRLLSESSRATRRRLEYLTKVGFLKNNKH